MENSSSTSILEEDEGETYFHDDFLSLIKDKSRSQEVIAILKNVNILDTFDSFGNSLLHVAAHYNNDEIMQYLIQSGCPIDIQNNSGKTPLITAMEINSFESIAPLVKANANILISDDLGKNALNYAVDTQWFDAMEYLSLIMLKKIESQCLGNSETIASKLLDVGWPLTYVVILRNIKVTKIMLDRGCQVDCREPDENRTALHEAVILSDKQHVKLLLDYNADPNALDKFDRSPIYYLVDPEISVWSDKSKIEIIKMLIDRGAALVITNGTSSHSQVDITLKFGDRKVIEILLQANLDLSKVDSDGNNALHLLASNTETDDVFEALAGYTFDIESRNSLGETPLIIAASHHHLSAVKHLLKTGADINAVNSRGRSALFRCIEQYTVGTSNQCKECVQLLLEHGADVEIVPHVEPATLIDLVESYETIDIHKLLIAYVALREASGVKVSDLILHCINSNYSFSTYYKFCNKKLAVVMCDSVTLHDLLKVSDGEFECFLANRKLASRIKDVINKWQRKVSYYDSIIRKRYYNTLRLSKLKKEAGCHLFLVMKISYVPLIAHHIVNYLDEQDLQHLLKVPV